MTTTLPATATCTFDWCGTDHTQEPGHHTGVIGTFADMYGKTETVSLYHCPDTGRTCLFLGEHEVSPITAMSLALLLQQAGGLGADIPGAVVGEIAAAGAR